MLTRVSIHEPTINCPHCHQDIKLTESLAAPLLKSKELELNRKESELRDREAKLQRERDAAEQSIADRFALERKKVAEDEQRKARLALGIELETKQRELKDLSEVLKARDTKRAEARARRQNARARSHDRTARQREGECNPIAGEARGRRRNEAQSARKRSRHPVHAATDRRVASRYLTGSRLRQRMQAMVEAFTAMQDDLNVERKAIQKQWAKREAQLERMMQSTVGMYGDLQGIAGKSMQEIEGVDLLALDAAGVE